MKKNKIITNIFENKKSFEWNEIIHLSVTNTNNIKKTIPIEGKMGLIRKKRNWQKEFNYSFVDWKGIAFSQFNRKLVYPPNKVISDENEMCAYQLVEDHPGQSKQPLTRIFGEFSFTNLWFNDIKIVKPDDNKRSFIWVDQEAKTDFFNKLKNLFEYKYAPLSFAFHKLQGDIDNFEDIFLNNLDNRQISDDKIIEKIGDEFNTSFILGGINKLGDRFYTIKIGDEEYEIFVKHDSSMLNNDSLIKTTKINDKNLRISMNLNHSIWKPLFDNTTINITDNICVIEKIAILFGLVEFGESKIIDFNNTKIMDLINEITERLTNE